jgi:hypothetical protein
MCPASNLSHAAFRFGGGRISGRVQESLRSPKVMRSVGNSRTLDHIALPVRDHVESILVLFTTFGSMEDDLRSVMFVADENLKTVCDDVQYMSLLF